MVKKLNPCPICDIEISKNFILINGHKFCSSYCAILYSKKTIAELNSSILKWKNAWFELREIIGDIGLQYIIEPRFEINKK